MLRHLSGDFLGYEHGDPPFRVLGLPGWMRTVSDFSEALLGLPAISVDLPGFGGVHPPPPTGWSTFEYAEALMTVVKSFTTPPLIVGHSFGGRIALQLAANHPEAVSALLLTGVPDLVRHKKAKPSLRYQMMRTAHRHGLLSDHRIQTWKSQHGSEDYRRAEGVMRDVLVQAVNEDYERQLTSIRVPVTFLWGDSDTAAPLVDVTRAVELVAPGLASLSILPGVGHMTLLQVPGAIRSQVEGWLANQELG